MSGNVKDIVFCNFPDDFSKSSNFFLDILAEIANDNTTCGEILSRQNFLISNCYTQKGFAMKSFRRFQAEFSETKMTKWLELQHGLSVPKANYSKRLWITYENRRPPSSYFQRTLSFDLDDFNGLNHYLPLWVLYIDFLGNTNSWVRHNVRQDSLLKSRILSTEKQKKGFLCVFINNPDPIRIRAIQGLSKLGEVHIYGRYAGNYIADKLEVSKQYQFSLCFENDLYPGYVTEKPLEAWLGETIPLYWGHDAGTYLNPNALINLNTFANLKDFIDYVAYVKSSEALYRQIYQEPLLQKMYDTNALITFIREWVLE